MEENHEAVLTKFPAGSFQHLFLGTAAAGYLCLQHEANKVAPGHR